MPLPFTHPLIKTDTHSPLHTLRRATKGITKYLAWYEVAVTGVADDILLTGLQMTMALIYYQALQGQEDPGFVPSLAESDAEAPLIQDEDDMLEVLTEAEARLDVVIAADLVLSFWQGYSLFCEETGADPLEQLRLATPSKIEAVEVIVSMAQDILEEIGFPDDLTSTREESAHQYAAALKQIFSEWGMSEESVDLLSFQETAG